MNLKNILLSEKVQPLKVIYCMNPSRHDAGWQLSDAGLGKVAYSYLTGTSFLFR